MKNVLILWFILTIHTYILGNNWVVSSDNTHYIFYPENSKIIDRNVAIAYPNYRSGRHDRIEITLQYSDGKVVTHCVGIGEIQGINPDELKSIPKHIEYIPTSHLSYGIIWSVKKKY